MSLIPTWPIAVGAMVLGALGGAALDHTIMGARIDRMEKATAEVDRQRAEIRAADERDSRTKEQTWAARVGQVEQEKTNAIAQVQAAGAAALNSERMRQRTERRPAPSGGVPEAAATCAGATGAELSRPDATFLVGFAQRADEQRAALGACYSAYDALK